MKKFIISSSTVGEGKSTTASYLAITISKYRQTSTLLIDFDLRKPKIHQIFGMDPNNGLTDILERAKPAKTCFKETPIPNLKVLTSGKLHQSPSELFNSNRINDFFKEICFYFDTIIIDSAPVIPVSDSLLLSPETDGMFFVVRAGKTPRDVARRARDLMNDAGVNILGVIINDVEGVLPYYYNHDYYGYRYYGNERNSGK
ncbi:CpsD/CapB family tyrosine-protein kinase [candidate division KSB1 bacterium]|nr:CpsD/CapB family tyrosine-protein kinase [candidate division KSB1 bacterium]